MFSEICSEQVCLFVKLRMVSVLFLVVFVLPYLKYLDHNEGAADMESFCQKIRAGSEQSQVEIPFHEFLRVLSRNSYSGIWQTSIKQSKLLKQQNGTIQLRAHSKPSENEKNAYALNIKIYDGRYRDDGNLQIQLNSSSVRTQQQYVANQVIFQTTSPMIGLYRNQKIFMTQKEKPIFINKLKFRLNLNQTLKIQLLLAAEYQINVITESLSQTWQLFHEILFSLLICCQVLIQAYGSYCLLLQAQEQDLIANSISPTFLKLGISFDTAELLVMCYLIYYEKMTMLVVPAYLLLLLVIFLQPYLYSKVSGTSKPQHHHHRQQRQQFQRIQRQVLGQNPNPNQSQPQQNSLLGNQNLKSLVSTLQRNQNYLMCICSYLIFYINNMQNYIYLIFFFILLLPQITRNCRIANKINYSIENILAFSYPRLIPIVYLRVFGIGSSFMFEPRYLFCLVCLVFLAGGTFVLVVQKKHGARSILPKFLIPKGMKAKFKFFAIQDQNIVCIVCRSELSQIPAELKGKPGTSQMKEQIVYNKVVLTPCHHKFHAHCLQSWMESRTQCPSCHHILPPSDSH